jgi:predicted acyltransferase (DUF342 family)
MDPNFIKRHTASETIIIKKKSFFDKDVALPANTIIGTGSTFWGNLIVKGSLELGKGSLIKGNVIAEKAIIGADCNIQGNIKVRSDLLLMDRTSIGGLAYAGGNMIVRPYVSARAAECVGDIEITGKTDLKSIKSGHRIVARRD